MAIKIIVTFISALILGVGLYYLIKERNDQESRIIYEIISGISGVIFVIMLILTILAL